MRLTNFEPLDHSWGSPKTASFAATLALTGCSGSDEAEADAPLEFLVTRNPSTTTSQISSMAPTNSSERRPHLMVESKGTELQDQDRSAESRSRTSAKASSSTTTHSPSPRRERISGSWGYRYDARYGRRTHGPATSDEVLVFTEIWDYAEPAPHHATTEAPTNRAPSHLDGHPTTAGRT